MTDIDRHVVATYRPLPADAADTARPRPAVRPFPVSRSFPVPGRVPWSPPV